MSTEVWLQCFMEGHCMTHEGSGAGKAQHEHPGAACLLVAWCLSGKAQCMHG